LRQTTACRLPHEKARFGRCIVMNLPKGPVVTLVPFVAAIAVALFSAVAAHAEPVAHGSIAPEDRYIAARDAAIEKLSAIYDAGKFDDAATAAEEAARADLAAQISAILNEPRRAGFGAPTINLESFYKGDEGFGTLDGLRFDDELGANGEKAGGNGADGKYVEPRAHIIVTTQTLFERWLRAHKEWWGRKIKNVPQRIGDALRDESFYTQAISSGAAVIDFNALPIAKPGSAIFAHAMLAGRTQSEVPDAADEIFVSAIAGGKVYVAYGSIKPEVRIAACTEIRAVTTSGPPKFSNNSSARRSTGRPMTDQAICAKRARTPSSAASPNARRNNRPLPTPRNRQRGCWRRRWDDSEMRDGGGPIRHCEEHLRRSNPALPRKERRVDCFAALAMTAIDTF